MSEATGVFWAGLRVIAVCSAFALITACDNASPRASQQPPASSGWGEVEVVPTVAPYELQEKCARDAREWYDGEWKDEAFGYYTVQYRNHYSQKFGTCVAVVIRTGVFPNMLQQYTHSLWDVLENREIGRVNWWVDHGVDRGVGDGAFMCVVNGGPCKSHPEWDALVKPYMEE